MPVLSIKASSLPHLKRGYPWVFRSDLHSSKTPLLEPGTLVTLIDTAKKSFALGYYNPHTALACRILSFSPKINIDGRFFQERFEKALERRKRFFVEPFYRLVHAESDHLPGLVIDRFDNTFVCQTNTAGMERLKPIWVEALENMFHPDRIIFKDNSPFREKEKLPLEVHAWKGSLEQNIQVVENGLTHYTHVEGQKTGWFYDHRANREWIGSRAKKKTVLDLYTYQGGFGLLAASKGAKQVTLVDRSNLALQLASDTANNHHFSQCEFIQDDVFSFLEKLIEAKQVFDIVIADPPAFAKQSQHQVVGLKGYQKLAMLASQVTAPQGLLFIASCSHHASPAHFRHAVETGLHKASRSFRLLRKAGADKDHPIHPLLPETQYLKSLAYVLEHPPAEPTLVDPLSQAEISPVCKWISD